MSAERQKAKVLYEEGLAAYRAGRYSDAIDKLLEADKVMPNAAFSYNIALVYEAMGDNRSALRWLSRHLRQSGDEVWSTTTTAKVRRFEKELQAQGLQQVTILSRPAGATVWIDGHALGISPFTAEIVPGSHFVSLSLEGYEPTQKTFELRADRAMDVEVELVAAKAGTPSLAAVPAPLALAAEPRKSSFAVVGSVSPSPFPAWHLSRVRPWTWISFGVGAAMFGGAAVFELKRQRDEDAAKSASQLDYQSRWDEMDSSKTAARVLVVAGSVVTAAGVALLTIDLTNHGPVTAGTVGSCTNSGICASMRGQF